MSLVEDLNTVIVDRCIVCGGENPSRMRRTITATVGGAYAEIKITIEYCADNPACGEAKAMSVASMFLAPFVERDLHRRGYSLFDLSVPGDSE